MTPSDADNLRHPHDLELARLFENIRDGLVVADVTSGRIVVWNAAASTIFGYSATEAYALSLDLLIPEHFSVLLGVMLAQVPATAQSSPVVPHNPVEMPAVHKSGVQIQIEISLSPLECAGDERRLVVAIIRDITAHVQETMQLHESQARFHSAFTYAAIGMSLVAPDGCFMMVNPALCELIGYAEQELLRLRFQDITYADDLEADLRESQRLLDGTLRTYQMEKRYIHKAGHLVWILLSVSLVYDPSGQPRYFLSQIQDINERKQAEAQLLTVNGQLASRVQELQEHTRELTILSELNTMIQACRTAPEAYVVIASSVGKVLPHQAGSLSIFRASRDLCEPVARWGEGSDATAFAHDACWALRNGQIYSVDAAHSLALCRHVSAPAPAAYICLPLRAHGETLGLLHLQHADPNGLSEGKRQLAQTIIAHLSLMLANLNMQDSLRYQSLRDALTGCYNRRYLEGELERETNRALRLGQPIGVLMMDIDHYKQFNDTYGHSAGDTVLRAVGHLLRSQSRGEDIVCRYGGEEFGLMLPGASLETSLRRAEYIRHAIKQLQVEHGGQLVGQITCSIGVSAFPQHGATLADVIEGADQALYRAKHAGRDRVATG